MDREIWENEVINKVLRYYARRHKGLLGMDTDDLIQELRCALLTSKIDLNRPDYPGLVRKIASRRVGQLRAMANTKMRNPDNQWRNMGLRMGPPSEGEKETEPSSDTERIFGPKIDPALQIDTHKAIGSLPPHLRRAALAILYYTKTDAIGHLGISRRKLDRMCHEIRKYWQEKNLCAYVRQKQEKGQT